MQPPKGVFRKRIWPDCVDDLEMLGFLTNPEKNTMQKGYCERCGRLRPITKIYRYTLSCRARAQRGLD